MPKRINPNAAYRGTSLIRNNPPPLGHHRALDTVLLYGPTRGLFLMSEVPLLERAERASTLARGLFMSEVPLWGLFLMGEVPLWGLFLMSEVPL